MKKYLLIEMKGRKRNDTEKSFIFYVNDFLISCELSPPKIICMYVYLYRCQSVLHSTALHSGNFSASDVEIYNDFILIS